MARNPITLAIVAWIGVVLLGMGTASTAVAGPVVVKAERLGAVSLLSESSRLSQEPAVASQAAPAPHFSLPQFTLPNSAAAHADAATSQRMPLLLGESPVAISHYDQPSLSDLLDAHQDHSLIPLPPAVWTGMSGLLGLGVAGFMKNARRLFR